jgi:serine/threonine protein kinase
MARTQNVGDRLVQGARIGDYVIQGELRTEDTGLVYEATHVVLPRRAAIKLMRSPWMKEMAIQVVREACVLEGLDHPGIPRVYECGVLSDRRPWIALERMDGMSIAEAVAPGTLSVPEVIYLLRDAGEILAAAHKAGVVHRLVTAANLVRTSGRKFPFALLNWAEAYTLEFELDNELPPGLVDERDDVHALGVIAYRALTGEIAQDHVSCAGLRPSAPQDLAQLIDQMLEVSRERRPSSAQVKERATAIAHAIERVAPSHGDKPRWTPATGVPLDRIPTRPPAKLAVGSAVAVTPPPPPQPPPGPEGDDELALPRTLSEIAVHFKPRGSTNT